MAMKIILVGYRSFKKLNVPVYATRFTLGLIELKLKEHKILRESELIKINPTTNIQIGEIKLSFSCQS